MVLFPSSSSSGPQRWEICKYPSLPRFFDCPVSLSAYLASSGLHGGRKDALMTWLLFWVSLASCCMSECFPGYHQPAEDTFICFQCYLLELAPDVIHSTALWILWKVCWAVSVHDKVPWGPALGFATFVFQECTGDSHIKS